MLAWSIVISPIFHRVIKKLIVSEWMRERVENTNEFKDSHTILAKNRTQIVFGQE